MSRGRSPRSASAVMAEEARARGKGAANQIAKDFGVRLRKVRVDRGLSQAQLAVRAAIGREYVSQLERGLQEPRMEILLKLAGSLEVSVDDLAEGLY